MKSLIPMVCLLCSMLLISQPVQSAEVPVYQHATTRQADLSVQVARLEQTVAALQQQIALLQSVIKINGTTVEISSSRDLKIKAGTNLDINSGFSTIVKSTFDTTIQSGTSTRLTSVAATDINAGSFFKLQSIRNEITASSDIQIKSGVIRLNKANKPLATLGSFVGGNQIISGSPTILGE